MAGPEDVASRPGANADSMEEIGRYIRAEIIERYEVHSYRHAASILSNSCPDEFLDIEQALLNFELTTRQIEMPGGNESEIPKSFSEILRRRGWCEARISGDLHVNVQRSKNSKSSELAEVTTVIPNYLDGHKIDYVKNRVAFDLEWNSKDQTFDRDLYAFRAFHECGIISAAVIITRSASLNPVFPLLQKRNKDGTLVGGSIKAKYGASTTWMGKLLNRLNAARHGGCPVLVLGITPKQIIDWEEHERNPKNR